MPHVFGAWGVLPFVAPLFAFVAARSGRLAFPLAPSLPGAGTGVVAGADDAACDRTVAGLLLAFASVIAAVRILALARCLTAPPLLSLFVAFAGCVAWQTSARPGRFSRSRQPDERFSLFKSDDAWAAPLLVVALAGLGLATVAARLLPVFQWDSLGYHLPFVHFTLAARGDGGVPAELEYIGSYPHDVELFFVALRACLPDDRLIDLGQVPFGVAGALVIAALGRRSGASPFAALGAGAAWVLAPAVFLQLPTDYVDVATAFFVLAAVYFVLSPPSAPSVVLAGLALGLFVGSKPSAPIPAGILALVLGTRAVKAGFAVPLGCAFVLALLFGAESYAANIVSHHNPVWPVRLDLGPIHLPGEHTLHELLSSGAAAPHLTGPLPSRIVRSFVSLTSPPTFDMRVGGFGALFLLALPFALATLVRVQSVALWLAFLSTFESPDPAVARYVLAFLGLVLALAAPWLHRIPAPLRGPLWLGFAVTGGLELVYAAPGLCGDGPPLSAYLSMTEDERALAVGADVPPVNVARARARIGPGESFAFDENMDLSDLAWDSAQSYPVLFLSPREDAAQVGQIVEREHVRVLAVGDSAPGGMWARAHPLQFERLGALPSCRKGSCSLFARR